MKISPKQDYSQLFGNLSARKDANNIFNSINLSDYATVKNGSYGKLLKAYYAPEKTDTKNTSKNISDIKKEDNKDIKKEASNIKSAASQLKDAFESVATSQKDITKDDIKNFVDKFNDLSNLGTNSSDNVTKAMSSGLKSLASRNSDELSKLGINIDKNGTLKFDEKTFDKIENKENLSTSFTKDMNSYIVNIEKQAQSKIDSMSQYNKEGAFNTAINSGFGFDSFI